MDCECWAYGLQYICCAPETWETLLESTDLDPAKKPED